MAFDDLTDQQRRLVTEIIEKLITGKYESEFHVLGSVAGWEILWLGKDGVKNAEMQGFSETDIINLADEGYITIISNNEHSYRASLKPKAHQQYELFKQPKSIQSDTRYVEKPSRSKILPATLFVLGIIIALVTNVASSILPVEVRPYLWVSWPLLAILTIVAVILFLKQ